MTVATLGELKEKEREARRDLILAAARKLFAEKDFRSVTVREIAKAIGVSPGTIYRYYENLDDLFLDVFYAGAEEITERLDQANGWEAGLSIRRFCEIYISCLNENISFYQMMSHFMLGGKLSPEATDKLNPTMRELMSRVESVIKSAGHTDETRLISHALFSSLNGIMISYARYPGRNLEEIRHHTMHLAEIVGGFFEKGTRPGGPGFGSSP